MTFTTRDIVYTSGPDALKARLYLPEKPFAALVEVHGGAWIHGDLNSDALLNERLAAAGILVMAIDFRTNEPYPASIADINLAIRWLKREVKDHGLSPEKVGGLGTSSGGHQILLAALRPNDPRYTVRGDVMEFDASLAFVVAGWPVSDPAARYEYAKERNAQALIAAHDKWFSSPAAMNEANPLQILMRGEAGKLPRLLILQGGMDENFPPALSEKLADAWFTNGGNADLNWYNSEPHAFITKSPESENSKDAVEKILQFVRKI